MTASLVFALLLVAGVALIGIAAGLLPFALAAAGGAMLFVIANDVIPESRKGNLGILKVRGIEDIPRERCYRTWTRRRETIRRNRLLRMR